MSSHVFAYGSLMSPPIWQRVVRGSYLSARAVAGGHARYAIKDETYPGMVPQDGSSVTGMLYFEVSQEDIAALDTFEGDEYRRASIPVRLDSGETVQADTYIYLPAEKLSESPWLPEAFQMERFIDSYCREKWQD